MMPSSKTNCTVLDMDNDKEDCIRWHCRVKSAQCACFITMCMLAHPGCILRFYARCPLQTCWLELFGRKSCTDRLRACCCSVLFHFGTGAYSGAAGVTDVVYIGQCGSWKVTLTILEDRPACMIICIMYDIHSCSLAAD